MSRNLADYMALNYQIRIQQDDHTGDWVAYLPDLDGCISQGETLNEALNLVEGAKRVWLEVALECNDPIPRPSPEKHVSGKTTVRLGKALHRKLIDQAQDDDVSLNRHMVNLLQIGSSIRDVADQVKMAVAFGFGSLGSQESIRYWDEDQSYSIWDPTLISEGIGTVPRAGTIPKLVKLEALDEHEETKQ